MLNGKKDSLVPEKQIRDLFRAAKRRKEIKWYDTGHLLPPEAAEYAAEWIRKSDLRIRN
jgi:predicted esterase